MNKISIIKFVTNQASGEFIAIGLVGISDGIASWQFSDEKLKLVYRLKRKAKPLLEWLVANYRARPVFEEKYFNYLQIYNNNMIQFTKPSSISLELTGDNWNKLFEKFVNEY